MVNTKKKIISYLLAAAVLLLVANIILDNLYKKNSKPTSKELTRLEIETIVWKVLDSYGINAGWVKKKKFHAVNEDSINAEFFINIPYEVPIPLLLKDLNNELANENTSIVAKEMKIYGSTEVSIYTNEYLKFRTMVIPDAKLTRFKKQFSFIINDALDLTESRYSQFLSIHFPLACTVVPDPDKVAHVDSLSAYSKDYLVILNNAISNSKMKLVSEYSTGLLTSSVKNILNGFKKSKIILIDDKSILYNSPIYNYVRDEFLKRKIVLVPLKSLIKLETEDEAELFSKFNFHLKDTAKFAKKVFYTSFGNFEKLVPLVEQFEKRGNRLVSILKAELRN